MGVTIPVEAVAELVEGITKDSAWTDLLLSDTQYRYYGQALRVLTVITEKPILDVTKVQTKLPYATHSTMWIDHEQVELTDTVRAAVGVGYIEHGLQDWMIYSSIYRDVSRNSYAVLVAIRFLFLGKWYDLRVKATSDADDLQSQLAGNESPARVLIRAAQRMIAEELPILFGRLTEWGTMIASDHIGPDVVRALEKIIQRPEAVPALQDVTSVYMGVQWHTLDDRVVRLDPNAKEDTPVVETLIDTRKRKVKI